ncbi:MAG: DUF3052 domain-containing protein [Gemmatimonadota bacterium]
MPPVGYSGTPLARKLGLKAGQRVAVVRPPDHLEDLLRDRPEPLPLLRFSTRGARYDQLLLFARDRRSLERDLPPAADRVDVDGSIWVCWPKKSSSLFRDLTEDGVREQVFPLALVDIKVCAVDADWSGLKVVYRKEERPRIRASR